MPMLGMSGAREFLEAIKSNARGTRPTLCIPVGNPVRAYLRPVSTTPDDLNADDIAVLTEWRNRFVKAFLTEFASTPERTARWLTNLVGKDDRRILFMLDTLEGVTVAYIGLAFIDWGRRSGEADAVVRGREAAPGLMTAALQTLMSWARAQLRLTHLGVRVRSDNTALDFYKKAGFVEQKRIPIRKTTAGEETHWVEDPAADPAIALVYMEYRPA
jgi:RimJ/RimL family protein N-acetyltransferase